MNSTYTVPAEPERIPPSDRQTLISIVEAPGRKGLRDLLYRGNALRNWINEDKSRINDETRLEFFALNVMGNESMQEGEQGLPGYFQPSMQMDGMESPGRDVPSSEALAYWEHRSQTSKLPQLRARYTDLVIDFSERITGKAPHNELRQRYIRAVLDAAAEADVDSWYATHVLLRRALVHAHALKRKAPWAELAAAVLHVDCVAEAKRSHLPTFSLELLRHRYIKIDKDTRQALLQKFEVALAISHEPKKSNFFKAERALEALLAHFRSDDQRLQRLAFVRQFETYTDHHEAQDSGLRADKQWERVMEAFEKEGNFAGVNRALAHRRRIKPRARADMRSIPIEFELNREPIEKWLEAVTAGEPVEQLMKFACSHAPPGSGFDSFREGMQGDLRFEDMVTVTKMDSTGRPVTSGVGIEQDEDTRLLQATAQFIQISPLIHLHMERLQTLEWFNANTLASFILGGTHVELDQPSWEAIQLYFHGFYLPFVLCAIPRLERMIRLEAERLGAPTTRKNKTGGIDHRLLNELLTLDELEATFHPQFLLYLRALLTEKHGLNLRNDLLHGITPAPTATSADYEATAHRILHALCAVGYYIQVARLKDGKTAEEDKAA